MDRDIWGEVQIDGFHPGDQAKGGIQVGTHTGILMWIRRTG
jgi:hypothetical protein